MEIIRHINDYWSPYVNIMIIEDSEKNSECVGAIYNDLKALKGFQICLMHSVRMNEYDDIINDIVEYNIQFCVLPITKKSLQNKDVYNNYLRFVKKHIPVLPILFETVDKELYTKQFGDVYYLDRVTSEGSRVSYNEKLRIFIESNTIAKNIVKDMESSVRLKSEDQSMHNYYLGLAYLYGLGVEIDREYGIKLLKDVACEGKVLDVYKKLSEIYRYGIGVDRNIENSAKYMKKYICEQKKGNTLDKKELLNELRILREILREDENNTYDDSAISKAEWKAYDPCGFVNVGMEIIDMIVESGDLSEEYRDFQIAKECNETIGIMINHHYLVEKYIYNNDDASDYYAMAKKAFMEYYLDNGIGFNSKYDFESDYWVKMLYYANLGYKSIKKIYEREINKDRDDLRQNIIYEYQKSCKLLERIDEIRKGDLEFFCR